MEAEAEAEAGKKHRMGGAHDRNGNGGGKVCSYPLFGLPAHVYFMFLFCFETPQQPERQNHKVFREYSTSSAGVSYFVGGRQLLVGGNTFLRRQYYPCLSRALCWEAVSPPFLSILNLSPPTSSSDALPPGSPGDRLRGIQRRASCHKAAARGFLHKLWRDHWHLIIGILLMSPGGK